MASFTIILNDPVLRDFVFPAPTLLGFEGLEDLSPEEDSLSPGHSARLNHKLQLLPKHLGLLVSRDQQARREVAILAGVIDPDHQERVRKVIITRQGKEKLVPNHDCNWTRTGAWPEKEMETRA